MVGSLPFRDGRRPILPGNDALPSRVYRIALSELDDTPSPEPRSIGPRRDDSLSPTAMNRQGDVASNMATLHAASGQPTPPPVPSRCAPHSSPSAGSARHHNPWPAPPGLPGGRGRQRPRVDQDFSPGEATPYPLPPNAIDPDSSGFSQVGLQPSPDRLAGSLETRRVRSYNRRVRWCHLTGDRPWCIAMERTRGLSGGRMYAEPRCCRWCWGAAPLTQRSPQ
jgi:hypothetical protein